MIKRNDRQTKHLHDSTCHWDNQHLDRYPSHRPFLIRKCIVLSGIALSILGCIAAWYSLRGTPLRGAHLMGPPMNGIPFLQLAFYFCWVTLADLVSHFVLCLKASSFSDEEALLKIEKVKPQELDAYFDTRRNIRFVSLLASACAFWASLKLGLFASLIAFCVVYIASTILGILAVRCYSKGRLPTLIHRDRRYDNPSWRRPTMNALEYNLNYCRWQRGDTGACPML